jgi:hypothetical protein
MSMRGYAWFPQHVRSVVDFYHNPSISLGIELVDWLIHSYCLFTFEDYLDVKLNISYNCLMIEASNALVCMVFLHHERMVFITMSWGQVVIATGMIVAIPSTICIMVI